MLFRICYAYLMRIFQVLFLPPDTLVYIGAELLPYFPSWMEKYLRMRNIKYMVEFDDAVFHNYDINESKVVRCLYGKKFEDVISHASVVICGCQYLADYTRQWNESVIVIPTCIDEEKYNVPLRKSEKVIVGWIGSPSSSYHLTIVIAALKRLQREIDYELHLIGFDSKYEKMLEGLNYKVIKWSEDTEIENMSKFSIGIMPLKDTPFSRGKCAFKLVQYMAMGLPTISSPLSSNIEIDKGCGNLFANSDEEWYDAFKTLLYDDHLRKIVGKKNKEIALKYYTFQATYQQKIEIFKSLGC